MSQRRLNTGALVACFWATQNKPSHVVVGIRFVTPPCNSARTKEAITIEQYAQRQWGTHLGFGRTTTAACGRNPVQMCSRAGATGRLFIYIRSNMSVQLSLDSMMLYLYEIWWSWLWASVCLSLSLSVLHMMYLGNTAALTLIKLQSFCSLLHENLENLVFAAFCCLCVCKRGRADRAALSKMSAARGGRRQMRD